MKKSGLEYDKRNIWEEPEAAAYVRSVADGNEVVPTVSVGSRSLVNPNLRQIVQVIGEESGGNLSDDELADLTHSQNDPQAGPLGKLLRRILSR